MCFVPKWKKEWRQCTALCFAGIFFTAGFFGLSSAVYYFASLYCIILHCIILSRARWPAWQNGKGRSWWLIGGGRGGQRRQRSLMLKWEILGLGFEESRKIRGGGSLVLKLKGGYRSDRILVMMSVKIKWCWTSPVEGKTGSNGSKTAKHATQLLLCLENFIVTTSCL